MSENNTAFQDLKISNLHRSWRVAMPQINITRWNIIH
jgi:hypothetical protein